MNKKILYCNCGGEVVSKEIKESTSKFLYNKKVDAIHLSDLCGLCAVDKQTVKKIFSTSASTLVLACHPRAVKNLLEFAGVDGEFKNVTLLDLREKTVDQTLSQLELFVNEEPSIHTEHVCDPEWPSWYPVIDYDRCTSCGQCADFCLFGVYEKQDGKVIVVNPKGCKNNCPACARICPHTAIIFPKYKMGGAISGSDSIDEAAELQRQQQDLKSILGSDIYKALEQRKVKRQSIIREEAIKKAMEERDNAKKN